MDIMKIIRQAIQQLEERSLSATATGVVLDTMHPDDAFIRIAGNRVDIHARNDNHVRLNGETLVRGQLRMLGSPDSFRVGALHQLSTQLLQMVPSTGVSPLNILVPHNPISMILQLLSLL